MGEKGNAADTTAERTDGGSVGGDPGTTGPAGIAVSDPGVPGDKGGSKPKGQRLEGGKNDGLEPDEPAESINLNSSKSNIY